MSLDISITVEARQLASCSFKAVYRRRSDATAIATGTSRLMQCFLCCLAAQGACAGDGVCVRGLGGTHSWSNTCRHKVPSPPLLGVGVENDMCMMLEFAQTGLLDGVLEDPPNSATAPQAVSCSPRLARCPTVFICHADWVPSSVSVGCMCVWFSCILWKFFV